MNFFNDLIEVRQGQKNFATLLNHCVELGMVSIIAIVTPGIPNIFHLKKKPTSMKKHHNFDPMPAPHGASGTVGPQKSRASFTRNTTNRLSQQHLPLLKTEQKKLYVQFRLITEKRYVPQKPPCTYI